MKHPKRITVEMKKALVKNGYAPNMYWVIKNTSTEFVFVHKGTNETVLVNKEGK